VRPEKSAFEQYWDYAISTACALSVLRPAVARAEPLALPIFVHEARNF
jgi:hypothetical protein